MTDIHARISRMATMNGLRCSINNNDEYTFSFLEEKYGPLPPERAIGFIYGFGWIDQIKAHNRMRMEGDA